MAADGITLDLKELEAFERACHKIGKEGALKPPGKGGAIVSKGGTNELSGAGIQKVFRQTAKIAAGKAAKTAPASGRKDWYTWRKSKRVGGGSYEYEGKHGDLSLKSTYKPKIFRNRTGMYLQTGAGKPTPRKQLQIIVSKFAGFDVRRTPGGRATKGSRPNWIQKAIDQTTPLMAKGFAIAAEATTAAKLNAEIKKNKSTGGLL